MKKITSILLIFALALSLCACSGIDNLKNVDIPPLPDADAETAAPDATETPAPTLEVTAEPVSALPDHVIVRVTPHSEQHYDPQNGTTLILTFSYDSAEVYIEGRDEASSAVNEYLATVDETYYTGNDYGVGTATGLSGMLEIATDNYTYAVESGLTDSLPLECAAARTASIKRIDSNVLSLLYNSYSFTGGAHGDYVNTGYVFDTETGEHLTLESLSDDYAGLSAFLLDYMCNLYEEDADGYYSDRVVLDMIDNGDYRTAFSALLRDGSWYFDENGLVIFSSVYELGPYAAGETEFQIPYSDLSGHIYDKYLQSAYEESTGSLSLKAQGDIEDGSIEIIDKVTVDEGGTALALVAGGTVYDVRLTSVEYSGQFYETAQLWACSYMSDCVLQLETLIPEGMPNLLVSYRDYDGTQHRLLITQSGENGGYVLTDADTVEAVG